MADNSSNSNDDDNNNNNLLSTSGDTRVKTETDKVGDEDYYKNFIKYFDQTFGKCGCQADGYIVRDIFTHFVFFGKNYVFVKRGITENDYGENELHYLLFDCRSSLRPIYHCFAEGMYNDLKGQLLYYNGKIDKVVNRFFKEGEFYDPKKYHGMTQNKIYHVKESKLIEDIELELVIKQKNRANNSNPNSQDGQAKQLKKQAELEWLITRKPFYLPSPLRPELLKQLSNIIFTPLGLKLNELCECICDYLFVKEFPTIQVKVGYLPQVTKHQF